MPPELQQQHQHQQPTNPSVDRLNKPIIYSVTPKEYHMSNSLSMRVLVVSITICMGLYDIAKYYFSKAKSLFLKNFFKCPKHNDHDARMDCSICQRVRDVPHRNFRSEECPICFSTMKNRVFFNCNHSCCGVCCAEYWEKSDWKQLRCFSCRQNVWMIYRDFKASKADQTTLKLRTLLRSYNATFAPKQRSLFRRIAEAPYLLKRTLAFFSTREGIMHLLGTVFSSHLFLAGILYIISPLDLLPECIFGIFGLLDDLVVMGILFVLLTNFYYRYLLRQDRDNAQQEDD